MRLTPSVPLRVAVGALVVAVAAMVLQMLTGVHYGKFPPGPFLVALTAALLAFVHWKPVRVIGILLPAFIFLGGFVSSNGQTAMGHPGDVGPFVGMLLELACLAIAVVAVVASFFGGRRTPHAVAS